MPHIQSQERIPTSNGIHSTESAIQWNAVFCQWLIVNSVPTEMNTRLHSGVHSRSSQSLAVHPYLWTNTHAQWGSFRIRSLEYDSIEGLESRSSTGEPSKWDSVVETVQVVKRPFRSSFEDSSTVQPRWIPESKSRGSFMRTWKCDANIEASTSEKDFSIQRLSLDSQKWKWKWYKSTESIMSILSKWTLSSLPNF